MFELRSLTEKLSNFSSTFRGQKLYRNINYQPLDAPRTRHRRTLSLSSFRNPRVFCVALLAIAFLLLSGTIYFISHSNSDRLPPWDGGAIPPGQSRDRGGQEIFWWEQFPKLIGLRGGIKDLVPFDQYVPEQVQQGQPFEPLPSAPVPVAAAPVGRNHNLSPCYLDEERAIAPPALRAYQGVPQGMSAPLFGSYIELDIAEDVCYDRVNRYGPYGFHFPTGEAEGELPHSSDINYENIKWGEVQGRCYERNKETIESEPRTAFIIRTWDTFDYTPYHLMMLRAMVSELSLASGGKITLHFLIHVQNDSLPIWASNELYNKTLKSSLPAEFEGMGTLWSVAQMRLIYPPPFPKSLINFSGTEIYEAYRSLHFPLQYFASQHPEYDYFWEWEMDIRVTGHYNELLTKVIDWADKQSRDHLWERSSHFFIPSLYDNSYRSYADAVIAQTAASQRPPVSGPQLSSSRLFPIPSQMDEPNSITDLITFNPIFDPSQSRWAFHDDITGYNGTTRPPTRASLITASRLSRRLLLLMHRETYRNKHTMFPEMYPASIALHYGLKAAYATLPVFFDRAWSPPQHVDEIFNNANISAESKAAGMVDHGNGHFHGEGGSVFGPGEHVFRGSTYYSNADFAGYLWRRWLGNEKGMGEEEWENGEDGHGRMCLPMMVLHPVKRDL